MQKIFINDVGLIIHPALVSDDKKTTYTSYEVLIKNKKINILITFGDYEYITILVNNAMQKAFSKKLGKEFDNFEQALLHYKSSEVRTAINTVKNYIKNSIKTNNKNLIGEYHGTVN